MKSSRLVRILGPALAGFLLLTALTARAGLYDMIEMSVASAPGTGTITLGAAILPYQSITATPAISGETIDYQIRDGNNWENGRGILTFGGTITLTRGPVTSTNSNVAINAGPGAVVFLSPLAEDMVTTRYASQILAPISAPTCALANAATITPNLAGCVSNSSNGIDLGAVIQAQNTTFAFPTGLPTGGNLQFGLRINPGTFTTAFGVGYRFPATQLTGGQPVLTASTDNYVWCVSQEGSPPTLVDCNVSMTAMTAITPPAAPITVVNSGGGAPCGNGVTTCTAAIALTTGDLLAIYASDCSNQTNCSLAGTLVALSATPASGTGLTGCTKVTNGEAVAQVAMAGHWAYCTITSGGTPTVTVSWATAVNVAQVILFDLHGAAASPDAGIAHVAGGSSTTPSSTTNGNTQQSNGFLLSVITAESGGATITAGGTSIISVNNGNLNNRGQSSVVASPGSPFSATATLAPTGPWIASVWQVLH